MPSKVKEDLIKLGTKRRHYTSEDVSFHNCLEDIWVSACGNVYDLTDLVNDNLGPLSKPLLTQAGQDLSYLFQVVDQQVELKTWIDPETNLRAPYTPCGRFLHVPPARPTASWKNDFGLPWWKDPTYIIGKLSSKCRKVRIVNTLTRKEDLLEVAGEDSISEIQMRYGEFNKHCGSYTWKALGATIHGNESGSKESCENGFVRLDMTQTLEENGIPDKTEEFIELGLEEELSYPSLLIYFNDDLTFA